MSGSQNVYFDTNVLINIFKDNNYRKIISAKIKEGKIKVLYSEININEFMPKSCCKGEKRKRNEFMAEIFSESIDIIERENNSSLGEYIGGNILNRIRYETFKKIRNYSHTKPVMKRMRSDAPLRRIAKVNERRLNEQHGDDLSEVKIDNEYEELMYRHPDKNNTNTANDIAHLEWIMKNKNVEIFVSDDRQLKEKGIIVFNKHEIKTRICSLEEFIKMHQ